MADTADSKSVAARCASSSLASGTKFEIDSFMVNVSRNAQVVKLVDATDLKSVGV